MTAPYADVCHLASLFALTPGERDEAEIDGIRFVVEAGHRHLDPALRPLILIRIAADAGRRDWGRSVAALMAACDRHRRPLEGTLTLAALDGSAERAVMAAHRLGFHVPVEVDLGTVEDVPVAYLPSGLDLPFTEQHRALARHALGLDRIGGVARRNAACAAQGSADYAGWMEMRASGYACKCEDLAGRAFFWVTARGAQDALTEDEELEDPILVTHAVL